MLYCDNRNYWEMDDFYNEHLTPYTEEMKKIMIFHDEKEKELKKCLEDIEILKIEAAIIAREEIRKIGYRAFFRGVGKVAKKDIYRYVMFFDVLNGRMKVEHETRHVRTLEDSENKALIDLYFYYCNGVVIASFSTYDNTFCFRRYDKLILTLIDFYLKNKIDAEQCANEFEEAFGLISKGLDQTFVVDCFKDRINKMNEYKANHGDCILQFKPKQTKIGNYFNSTKTSPTE